MALKTINIQNHAYFVTSKVIYGIEIFRYQMPCQIMMDNLRFYEQRFKFDLFGYVIMPNHIHLIIWPRAKHTISDILRNLKEYSAKQIIAEIKNNRETLAPRPELGKNNTRAGLGSCSSQEGLNRNQILVKFQKAARNIKKQKYKLWQSRNWIENIYSQRFLQQKLDYIHNNPVRAELVKNPADYPYSSFNNYY